MFIQRDGKTKYGSEIYLWYFGKDKSWRFSTAYDFHARSNECFLYSESQRKNKSLRATKLVNCVSRTVDDYRNSCNKQIFKSMMSKKLTIRGLKARLQMASKQKLSSLEF